MNEKEQEEMKVDFRNDLKEIENSFEVDELRTSFGKGSFGSHELTDRAFIIFENFQTYLLGHPTTVLNKKLYERAWKINRELAEFYREVACNDFESEVNTNDEKSITNH